jgi:hypothetical protein
MTKYQRCSHQCCSQATDAIFVLVTHRAARIRHSLPAPCSLPSPATIAIVLRAKYDRAMLKNISILLALTTAAFAQDSAKDEAQVWNLEIAYWESVKANDLEKYRALWHEDFLGWPYVSSAPKGKDHITDWITANTSKGVKLQSYSIDQLAIRVTATSRSTTIGSKRTGQRAKQPKSGQMRCASPTHGFALMTHGKFSAACRRP